MSSESVAKALAYHVDELEEVIHGADQTEIERGRRPRLGRTDNEQLLIERHGHRAPTKAREDLRHRAGVA